MNLNHDVLYCLDRFMHIDVVDWRRACTWRIQYAKWCHYVLNFIYKCYYLSFDSSSLIVVASLCYKDKTLVSLRFQNVVKDISELFIYICEDLIEKTFDFAYVQSDV